MTGKKICVGKRITTNILPRKKVGVKLKIKEGKISHLELSDFPRKLIKQRGGR